MVTWVNNFTRSAPVVPDVDITYTADNVQKIGKTWHLEANSKQPTSVITNHIYQILCGGGQLQYNDSYYPRIWFPLRSAIEEIKITTYEESMYRALRLRFVESRLNVYNENEERNNSVARFADIIQRSRKVKYCTGCYCENDPIFLVRPFCFQSYEIRFYFI